MQKRRPRWTFLIVGALIWSIIFYSENVLITLSLIYVTHGPVLKLVHFVRRVLSGGVSPSEAAHGNIRS
jgi:hypothetical protein